jgi:hypothetical protein
LVEVEADEIADVSLVLDDENRTLHAHVGGLSRGGVTPP